MSDQMVRTADDDAATEASTAPDDAGHDPAEQRVSPAQFPELGDGPTAGGAGAGAPMHVLSDVDVAVTVELGRVRMRVRDLLALRAGSVVGLDRTAGAPVDVLVNGTAVARGEVVVVGDDLGVRITSMLQAG